jgi:hypothetical protein
VYYTVCTGNVGLDCSLQTDGSDHAISAWHGCRAIIGQPISVKVGTTMGSSKRKFVEGYRTGKERETQKCDATIHIKFFFTDSLWVLLFEPAYSLCGVLLLLSKSVELFHSSMYVLSHFV